ncbi:restriction endonuclease subunit S [Brachyspira hampsonii]|uniref:restriction endonuclease subunit S n=1 Tax=Brachyspira hampsonii TaxID=1287055 RepID=UPI000D34DD64|nr:restriction endonuclease subunit S [Brachyspira hampsonii]PTY41475.1 type I R-M system specificity subunit [Brachyspira hampsonii bv. II]
MNQPLPVGWKEIKLQECLLEQPKYGMNAPAVKYDNSLPTYIRITDIDEYGNFINDNKVSVNNANYEEYILHDNDFLFARTGASVGKTYLYNRKDGILVFAGYLIKVKPNQNILNSLFLKYYTQSKRYWHFVKITSARTGQPGINGKEYANMNIVLPPIDEQKRISEILSLCDDVIENLTQLIEKKELYKKGIMQRVLSGEVRFNGFGDEWKIKKLSEISRSIKTGKLDANAMEENGQYRFYTCAREYYRINEYAFDGEALLISGNGAYVGYVHYYKGKFNAYQRTYVLMDFEEDIRYIKYYLDIYLKDRIRKEKNEGNTPYIVLSTLTEMEIKVPSLEEQKKIAGLLSVIDEEIDNLKKQLELRKQQKKGLMQRLLSGEVRI